MVEASAEPAVAAAAAAVLAHVAALMPGASLPALRLEDPCRGLVPARERIIDQCWKMVEAPRADQLAGLLKNVAA